MNDLELETLQTPLSNLARVIYCVYLRPQLKNNGSVITINNRAIVALINSKEPVLTTGKQINALFEELENVGLVSLSQGADYSKSLHNHNVTLPLSALPQSLENPLFHSQHKSMRLDWRPVDSIFEDLCQLIGLIEKTYSAEELGEFIAYWLGRIDTQCTEYQWTQKLVIHLKQRRQRLPLAQQQSKAGHQYVTPSAGIVFDDNVKKLINQYKDQV